MNFVCVAQRWFAKTPDPAELFRDSLHRFSRENGWTAERYSLPDDDQGFTESWVLTAPYGAQRLQLRRHRSVPLLGFIDQVMFEAELDAWASSMQSWGYPYLNPPFVTWWQSAGWTLPEAAWLNAEPEPDERAELLPEQQRALRNRRGVSRGDAIFFNWA